MGHAVGEPDPGPGDATSEFEACTGTDPSPTETAERLLVACRRGDSPDPYEAALAAADEAWLRPLRESHTAALAFWLNCYNAGTQLLLERRPDRYESRLRSLRFFRAPAVTVAGTDLSLDRIENGILRGGRSKLGFGYLPKLLVTSFERRYGLPDCDPRVHFALNCGAASCPAIRVYDPGRVDEQLDAATRAYLDTTVAYDPGADVARLPRVFRWFPGDFGGPGGGVRGFLREYDALPDDAEPTLRYRSWDWTRRAGKFVE
ncbi:MAG: DUF547 domain-containing protein [Haloarculaceae archaeon]